MQLPRSLLKTHGPPQDGLPLARLLRRGLRDDLILPLRFLFSLLQKLSFTWKAMTSQAFGGYRYAATSALSFIRPQEFKCIVLTDPAAS